jgi:hypothetical protein
VTPNITNMFQAIKDEIATLRGEVKLIQTNTNQSLLMTRNEQQNIITATPQAKKRKELDPSPKDRSAPYVFSADNICKSLGLNYANALRQSTITFGANKAGQNANAKPVMGFAVNTSEWKQPSTDSGKVKPKRSITGKSSSKNPKMQAAKHEFFYFTTKWDRSTEASDLKEFIKRFAEVIDVEEVKSKYEKSYFKSFKFSAYSSSDSEIYNDANWPSGIQVRRWWSKKVNNGEANNVVDEAVKASTVNSESKDPNAKTTTALEGVVEMKDSDLNEDV